MKREEEIKEREEKISRKERKIEKWEEQQNKNEELQHERDEEFKKRIEAENKLLEEKQSRMEKQLELDRMKLEKAQNELEAERRKMELERIRLFESEKSSRAESGIGLTPPEVKAPIHSLYRDAPNIDICLYGLILNICQSDLEDPIEESPKPRRRRRRGHAEDRGEDARYSRRRGPVIGQAPNPDFSRIKPKIDNHGATSQHHRAR